jgi:hypothetical protein
MASNDTWVVGQGRCGTTLFIESLQDLGVNIDDGPLGKSPNGSEYCHLTRLNDKLIQEIYQPFKWQICAMPEGWEHTMYRALPKPESIEAIQSLGPKLPHMVKDPRWSITLPWWMRFGVVPKRIVYLKRDDVQNTHAWCGIGTMQANADYAEAFKATEQRRKNLERCLKAYEETYGVKVFRLHHPDFILEPEKASEVIAELTGKTASEACAVIKARTNLAWMHYYDTETGEKVRMIDRV